MIQTLKNDLLTVEVSTHGAELQSIRNNITGQEYLWCGDARFWGRHSPVLFPIVGSVWDGKYRMDGREYAMSQHGFARDCEFIPVVTDADDELWYSLEWSEDSLQKYPRRFRLEVGYRLQEERLTVMWRVSNLDDKSMAFQIGAHPAFNYPDFDAADNVHAYFTFDAKSLETERIAAKGCVGEERYPVAIDSEGMLPLTGDTFEHNALILAGSQVHRVSMLDKDRRPVLTLLFDAPLVGLWSPGHDAPFVCIEPWYGRCDSYGFDGAFEQRQHVNILAPGQVFKASYLMIFDNI